MTVAPRLQFRWEAAPYGSSISGGTSWTCHYELVLPLREYDIRRENESGEVVRTEYVIPIGPPTTRGSERVPCGDGKGHFFDTPYRDGAHAKWDAAHLGDLPIFAIAIDGTFIPAPALGGDQ